MAITKTPTTLSPNLFTTLGEVNADDIRSAAELQAYVVGECVPSYSCHFYTDVSELENFPVDSERSFEIWIPPWAIQVEAYIEVSPEVGVTGVDVDIEIGSDSGTVSLSSPWSGTITMDVADTGDEYQLVTIGNGSITGSGTAIILSVHVRVLPIDASDLPTP